MIYLALKIILYKYDFDSIFSHDAYSKLLYRLYSEISPWAYARIKKFFRPLSGTV
jgi:hypothetical protein